VRFQDRLDPGARQQRQRPRRASRRWPGPRWERDGESSLVTFLSPLTAIVAAAVTVPALLVLYFLKLRRRAVRVSSTLLWERAVQDLQVNTPFRWLRASWILLLQLLLLGLLVTALGRPAIDAGPAAGPRVILLVDRSASMSALDGIRDKRAASSANSPAV